MCTTTVGVEKVVDWPLSVPTHLTSLAFRAAHLLWLIFSMFLILVIVCFESDPPLRTSARWKLYYMKPKNVEIDTVVGFSFYYMNTPYQPSTAVKTLIRPWIIHSTYIMVYRSLKQGFMEKKCFWKFTICHCLPI